MWLRPLDLSGCWLLVAEERALSGIMPGTSRGGRHSTDDLFDVTLDAREEWGQLGLSPLNLLKPGFPAPRHLRALHRRVDGFDQPDALVRRL
jgi:hypothetical protein